MSAYDQSNTEKFSVRLPFLLKKDLLFFCPTPYPITPLNKEKFEVFSIGSPQRTTIIEPIIMVINCGIH